jgi:predicted Zn-dependent peptidase
MAKDTVTNPKYTKFILPNGVTCVVYPRKEIHSVKFKVIVNVGSLDEGRNTNGISHFIEHIVHDGTAELPTWKDIDDYQNEYSGSTNAYTTTDHTQYYGTFPHQYFKEAAFYFSQVVLHPLFKESDVEKERDIIVDEMTRLHDETDYLIYKNVKDQRFTEKNSPFSQDVIGTKSLLEKFSQRDINEFYDSYYVPNNIEIYVVGNVDIKEAKDVLTKYFYKNIENRVKAKLPERHFKKKYPSYSQFSINALQKKDINQYYLTVTFPNLEFLLKPESERRIESFVRSVLATGQYSQSVLWKRLREELGIVYGIGSYNYDLQSRAISVIQTSFDKDHLETVLTEIKKGTDQTKSGKITDVVFKAKQKRIVDTQLMMLDNPDNMIGWIVDHEDELNAHGTAMGLPEFMKFASEMKFDDVVKLSSNIFNWNNANIGIVSQDDPGEVEKKVKKIWDTL